MNWVKHLVLDIQEQLIIINLFQNKICDLYIFSIMIVCV